MQYRKPGMEVVLTDVEDVITDSAGLHEEDSCSVFSDSSGIDSMK